MRLHPDAILPSFTLVCATMLHGQLARSQSLPPAAPPGPRALAVDQLSPDVYWIQHTGFAAFLVGEKGVIVVDTGNSPERGRQILAEVARVTPKPVTAVILSHGDGDHVLGLPAFPAGIPIYAQTWTAQFLTHSARSTNSDDETPKLPAAYLPNRTVEHREDLVLNGIPVQLLHWVPAHTGGDLVVYLPSERLVLAGDVLVADQHNLPLIHLDKGGSSRGWIKTVRAMLALDCDRYVIGHEALVGKDALEQQLKSAIAEREKVRQLYDRGLSLAAIEDEVGDTPARTADGHPPHFPPYAEVIYREIKAGTY